jgi:hypothetical protein
MNTLCRFDQTVGPLTLTSQLSQIPDDLESTKTSRRSSLFTFSNLPRRSFVVSFLLHMIPIDLIVGILNPTCIDLVLDC